MSTPRHYRFLEISLILVAILAPLFFGAVYRWAYGTLWGVLFFLGACYPSCLRPPASCPRLFQIAFFLIFTFLLAQTFFFSLNPHIVLNQVIGWLAAACGFLLIQQLPYGSLVRWAYAMVVLGVIEACYGGFELLRQPEHVLWKEKVAHTGFLTGTYLNRNHLAGLLEICLGFQLGLWVRSMDKKETLKIVFLGTAFAISLTALVQSGSRAGLVSFLLSFLFFLPFLISHSPRLSFCALSWVVPLVLVSFFWGKATLLARLEAMQADLLSLEGRWGIWKETSALIFRAPWTGTGLGTFEWIFPHYQSSRLWMSVTHAHQDYLELFGEIGVLAGVIFIGAFLVLWFDAIRRLGRLKKGPFFLTWGALISVTAMGLHGFWDFNWAIPANALLTILSFGFLCRMAHSEMRERKAETTCL